MIFPRPLAVVAVLFVAALAAAQPGVPPAAPNAAPPGTPGEPIATGATGSLAIRAVQGTKGGPAVGEADIEVDLFHREQPIKRITARLDHNSVVIIDGLPVGMGVNPLVRVKYAGVMYQEAGPALSASTPSATMEVTVYETTEEPPPWKVTMRHVIAESTASGMLIGETVVVENPADRTWLGGAPDANGRRNVVTLLLPPAARRINLDSGFHGWCCTSLVDRTLTVQMPLMPGRATFRFSYDVPIEGGRADLRIIAPPDAPIDHVMFSIPDNGCAVETIGVAPGDGDTLGQARVRLFHAQAVPRGAAAGLVLTGFAAAAAPVALDHAGGAYDWPKLIGAVGGTLILGGGAAILLLRSTNRRPDAGSTSQAPPP